MEKNWSLWGAMQEKTLVSARSKKEGSRVAPEKRYVVVPRKDTALFTKTLCPAETTNQIS